MRIALFLVVTMGAFACTPKARKTSHTAAPAAPNAASEPSPTTTVAPLVVHNARILTAAGAEYSPGTLIAISGIIRYVGDDKSAPAYPTGAVVIDGQGRYVTPGLIDSHSHIGVYSVPSMKAHWDGNETVDPITPYARAEYGYWPGDPAISRAAAGGVTTALILPGSANLIGGQGFTVRMKPGRTVDDVRFPGAPPTLKMACGENPKRVYGEKTGPATRMAEYALFRKAFHQARGYAAKHPHLRSNKKRRDKNKNNEKPNRSKNEKDNNATAEPPEIDLGLETLARVLSGEILVQIHCYRSDEIAKMVAIADEFGFAVRSFHHALEAYKIRSLLAKRNIAISTWADWWGFKLEAFDGIAQNAALFSAAGGRAVIHSDSEYDIQRLNQEAAKAMHSGRRAGIAISINDALRWITANPAWVLGIAKHTGTLEQNKRADLVVWSKHPFSVYALPDRVFSAGETTFDRKRGLRASDFELGNSSIDSESTEARDPTASQRNTQQKRSR